MSLTNALPGQENTVLAGTSAVFRVSVKDAAGNPAANQSAVITLEADTPAEKKYELSAATTVVTTDANGNATFVVKPQGDTAVENNDERYVGTYKYTVKVNEESAEGILKVAAISYGVKSGKSVANQNGTAPYNAIKPGSNVDTEKNGKYMRETTDMNNKPAEYVGAQQVSLNDENKVAFKTDVFLVIPQSKENEKPAEDERQDINLKSEKYHTYASSDSTKQEVTLNKKDLSDVAYATVRFNSLKLSKHTRAVVKLKKTTGEETVATYGYDDVTFNQGEGFGLQLSKNQLQNAVSISFSLEAEGQVDLGSNDGYDVKDIVYVFNSQKVNPPEYIHYPGVKVNWEIEDKVYYEDEIQLQTNGKPVDVNNSVKTAYYDASIGKPVENAKLIVDAIKGAVDSDENCYNITYSAPAFPDTGNAIIRCYDRNNNVKKYFACATVNDGRNVNVLYFNTGTDGEKQNLLYEITDQEAKNNSADCKIVEEDPEQGLVVINTAKSGVTHLMGTVSSDDPKISAVLDAKNKHVYTSVMWNPVIDSSNDAAGIAFAGQTATVVAQLIDDKENPVAQSGQKINWTLPKGWADQGVKKVEEQTSTDPKGQATLKLSAAKAAELIGVNASTTSGYKVNLLLANEASTKGADIYWVDLHLEYRASAIKEIPGEDANTAKGNGADSGKATAKVGEKWEYASKIIAYSVDDKEEFQKGVLAKKKVAAVTGIVPSLSKLPSSKGTVDIDAKEGRATVTSDNVTDKSAIIFRLTSSNSPKSDATVKVKVGSVDYVLIGTGSISANETLTLNYEFETVGSEISFHVPNGNKSAQNEALGKDEQIVYLQLRDSKGNPIELKDGQRIKVSVSGSAKIEQIQRTDGYDNTGNYLATGATTDPLYTNELGNYQGEGNSKEVVYKAFSRVAKNGSTVALGDPAPAVGDPNKDGILAIKLTDTAKEDVVVTASYEEIKDTTTKTVNVLATQTQSYSFVDDDGEKLPVFTFDTAQDNGQNRIFYDSDKNEITVAFTNDILASSVKADQFIVQKGSIATTPGYPFTPDPNNPGNLVVKDVTVNGNKVVIKLTGSISDVTDKTYFKVFVGVDTNSTPKEVLTIDKNIRYIFTSADGQELGDKKSIVFSASRKASIAALCTKEVTDNFAKLDPADWNDALPNEIEKAIQSLALMQVYLPPLTDENEDRTYLAAIQSEINKLFANPTVEQIQEAAKAAIKEVQDDKAKANAAIENTVFKGKQLKGRALKGATAVAPSITIRNTEAVSASGSAIGVSITTTGSAIDGLTLGLKSDDDSSSLPLSTTLAPGKSGKLFFNATKSELAKDLKVIIEIKTRYYTRTYTISNFTVGKGADNHLVITGGKVEDKMVGEYHNNADLGMSPGV